MSGKDIEPPLVPLLAAGVAAGAFYMAKHGTLETTLDSISPDIMNHIREQDEAAKAPTEVDKEQTVRIDDNQAQINDNKDDITDIKQKINAVDDVQPNATIENTPMIGMDVVKGKLPTFSYGMIPPGTKLTYTIMNMTYPSAADRKSVAGLIAGRCGRRFNICFGQDKISHIMEGSAPKLTVDHSWVHRWAKMLRNTNKLNMKPWQYMEKSIAPWYKGEFHTGDITKQLTLARLNPGGFVSVGVDKYIHGRPLLLVQIGASMDAHNALTKLCLVHGSGNIKHNTWDFMNNFGHSDPNFYIGGQPIQWKAVRQNVFVAELESSIQDTTTTFELFNAGDSAIDIARLAIIPHN